MIDVYKHGILLSKTDLEFEQEGVLNPAVIRVGDCVHMYYRAVKKGNYSSVGYCKFDGPLTLVERWSEPIINPEFDYELQGVEDPRITKIDNDYYLTYTGYDGTNARGALAKSKNLIHFEKMGILVPPITYAEFVSIVESAGQLNEDYFANQKFYYLPTDKEKKTLLWDKNVVFFPRRIDGKLAFLHRLRPGIQVVMVKSLKQLTKAFWIDYFHHFQNHIVLDPIYQHESSYIGGGCPPIETEHGWLIIYHGVERKKQGLVYSACAALLDLNNPSKELSRLPHALFSPEHDWELNGEVNNVVFPTGSAVFGDTLFIYYGAADSVVACASVSLSGLVSELLIYSMHDEK